MTPCGTYDSASAIAYAKKWTARRNGAYDSMSDTDCTNFASQILQAGGMAFMREYETGHGSWWYRNRSWPFADDWTHSWSLADVLPRHLVEYGLAAPGYVGSARPGDLLVYDWKDGGPQFDHVNFATGYATNGDLLVVQHSTDYPAPKPYYGFFDPRAKAQHPHYVRCVFHITHTRANIR